MADADGRWQMADADGRWLIRCPSNKGDDSSISNALQSIVSSLDSNISILGGRSICGNGSGSGSGSVVSSLSIASLSANEDVVVLVIHLDKLGDVDNEEEEEDWFVDAPSSVGSIKIITEGEEEEEEEEIQFGNVNRGASEEQLEDDGDEDVEVDKGCSSKSLHQSGDPIHSSCLVMIESSFKESSASRKNVTTASSSSSSFS